MPRMGLDLAAVVDAATVIADAEGLEALTLTKLATVLGVKSPSLYNHVHCLGTLKMHLTAKALALLLNGTRDAMAGVAGEDALMAFCHTQRRFAKEHPGLWAAFKLPVAGWSEAAQATSRSYLTLALAIVRGYGLTGDDAIHAARAIRASLQGFIDLEVGGGFGLEQNVDTSFTTLLGMLSLALRQQSVCK